MIDAPPRELYTQTLSAMTDVLEAVRDEPDPDGALEDLARRIECDRAWVRSLLVLGEEPSRPPNWLRRVTAQAA